MAEEHAPSIVFIDEIDAVGTKRYDSNSGGEREIQRTMLELLNQLDGFDSRGDVKVKTFYQKFIYFFSKEDYVEILNVCLSVFWVMFCYLYSIKIKYLSLVIVLFYVFYNVF